MKYKHYSESTLIGHSLHFSHTIQSLERSETRMTWTLFIVCFCYFLFVLPRVVYTIFFGSIYTSGFQAKKNPWIDLSLYISYWSHYAINFFIYVVRIKKFRNAYFYLFKKVPILSTNLDSFRKIIFLFF